MHLRFTVTLIALATALLISQEVSAGDRHVPADYPTIKDAIAASFDGDIIWVAAGTYNELMVSPNGKAITIAGAVNADGTPATTIDAWPINEFDYPVIYIHDNEGRDTVFRNLRITGGRPDYYPGQGGGVSIVGNGELPRPTPTFENCEFFGNGHGAPSSEWLASAVYVSHAYPLFKNCTIRNNNSSIPAVLISNCNPTNPGHPDTVEFTDCHIYSNQNTSGSLKGGGVFVLLSRATFDGCHISDNLVNGNGQANGGGLYVKGDWPVTLNDCVITGNTAGGGGGGIFSYDASPTITNCTIQSNTALGQVDGLGGGIWSYSSDFGTSFPDINNSTVCDNDPTQIAGDWQSSAGGACIGEACDALPDADGDGLSDCQDPCPNWPHSCSGDGTTLYVQPSQSVQVAIDGVPEGGTVQLQAGTFSQAGMNTNGKAMTIEGAVNSDGSLATTLDGGSNNTVFTLSSNEGMDTVFRNLIITGGSGSAGGGMRLNWASPTIEDCHFTGNAAARGGALHIENSTAILRRCLIEDNQCQGGTGGGGLCNKTGGKPSLIDCVIRDNRSLNSSGGAGKGGGMANYTTARPVLSGTSVCGNYGAGTQAQIYNGTGSGWQDSGGNTVADNCDFDVLLQPGQSIQSAIDSAPSSSPWRILLAAGTFNEHLIDLQGKPITLFGELGSDGTRLTTIDGGHGGGSTTYGQVFLINSGETRDTLIRDLRITRGSHVNGGGILCQNGSPTIQNCHIFGNWSKRGGGIQVRDANPLILNCLIESNTAEGDFGGGGIGCRGGGVPDVVGCVIRDNLATWDDGWGYGGGIVCFDSSNLSLQDSSVCGNQPTQIETRSGGSWTDAGGNCIASTCNDIGDTDGDGTPDCADTDDDGDGIADVCDVDDTGGADCDANGVDDACDPDLDGDGTPDACDDDIDGDGISNACDLDLTGGDDCDANGIDDTCDADQDGDGTPDACDDDNDGDGIPDECDSDTAMPGFTDSGEMLLEDDSLSGAVALGDLDGDGDLDAFVGNLLHRANRVLINDGLGAYSVTDQELGLEHTLAIVLGDLDNDSDLDAWEATLGYNRIWFNDGAGQFTASSQFLDFFAESKEIDLADLDNDGDLDAYIANAGPNPDDHVFLNDGSGTMSLHQAIPNGNSNAVALGDLDGDGDIDAWLGTPSGHSVWLNDGAGTFSVIGEPIGNSAISAVALSDLDNDGDLDAWAANSGGPNQVWLNSGGAQGGTPGSFQEYGPGLGTSKTHDVALGDIDGDGDPDAITVNADWGGGDQSNRVWINAGDGLFTDSGLALGDSKSLGVALGDVDGDLQLDAWVVNQGEPNILYVRSGGDCDGDGQLDTCQTDTDGDGEIDPCDDDIDGDGIPNDDDWAPYDSSEWADGDGDGVGDNADPDDDNDGVDDACDADHTGGADCDANGVDDSCDPDQDGDGTPDTCDDDIDGDGISNACDLDLTGGDDCDANGIDDTCDPDQDGDGTPDACDNDSDGDGIVDDCDADQTGGADCDGNGVDDTCDPDQDGDGEPDGCDPDIDGDGIMNFCDLDHLHHQLTDSGQHLGSQHSLDVALGDFDADGDLDAIVANLTSNQVWLNDGTGGFTSGQSLGNEVTSGVTVGDVDGDGWLDAVTANTGPNTILLNDGAGMLVIAGQTSESSQSSSVVLADFDNDADLDLAVANLNNEPNRVWINQGGLQGGTLGTYADSGQTLGYGKSMEVCAGDLNGDDAPDLWIANSESADSIWFNDGTGTFTESWQSIDNLKVVGLDLGDLDGDGDLDAWSASSATEPNRVWLNDGAGNFDSGQDLGLSGSTTVRLVDVDGDGDPDALEGYYNQPSRLWINDGNGMFAPSVQPLPASACIGMALGDLDGDGDPDAMLANLDPFDSSHNLVLLNGGGINLDCDGDGEDDACESDLDLDGLIDDCDDDIDGDGIGNACDVDDTGGADCDANGVDDACDPDLDGDGTPDACDDDTDGDGIGNACDVDMTGGADCDANGVDDACDPDQDGDGTPDACDDDIDGDGIGNACDVDMTGGADCNANGVDDTCDDDLDGDGSPDACDDDIDGDGIGNACDVDHTGGADCDGNGVDDTCDGDQDGDDIPDACDDDVDGDGIDNLVDNCPWDANADQADCDQDGAGDVCELIDGTQEDLDANGIPDDCEGEPCLGDLDGTGVVDIEDLLIIMGAWGTDDADVNGDGTPDINDLLMLMGSWGACP